MSLPMRGAWIEIAKIINKTTSQTRRSPCGERGLKSRLMQLANKEATSLPMRGAWIEILQRRTAASCPGRSPCGERGLKFCDVVIHQVFQKVAPHAGSVD